MGLGKGRRRALACRHALLPMACRRLAAGPTRNEAMDGSTNPLALMDLRPRELSNFFERGVSAYQVGITGDVVFDQDF